MAETKTIKNLKDLAESYKFDTESFKMWKSDMEVKVANSIDR